MSIRFRFLSIIIFILGIAINHFRSLWNLPLHKEIFEQNIPAMAINKKKFKNADIFLTMVKRKPTSLMPYESVGK